MIAHISDLHFKPAQAAYRTDPKSGQHIVELIDALVRLKPDFIALTGDVLDDPDEAAFQSAAVFVEDLRKSTGVADCCMAVIPGNHDLVKTGFVPSFANKLKTRLKWFQAALARWTLPYRHIEFEHPAKGQSFHLKVASLNSNSDSWDLNLAGGRVIDSELKALRASMGVLQALEPYTTRLALVHHHLLPIAEAQLEGASAIEKEQFHLLMNAGVVMREMVSCGIEIVLHGHRHHSGFARVVYPVYAHRFNSPLDQQLKDFLRDAVQRSISILGAGSCGKPDKPTGPFQFNIVNLYLDGRVHVDEYERDSQSIYRARPAGNVALTDGPAAFNSRYRWVLGSSLTSSALAPMARAQSVRYSVRVTEHGDGYGFRETRGFRALSGTLTKFPFIVRVDSGYFSERQKPLITSNRRDISITWEKDSNAAPPLPRPGQPEVVSYPGFLRFDPPVGAEKQHEVDFGVHTTVPNAFRNHLGVDPEREHERIGFTVRPALLEQLLVCVRFDDEASARNVSPFVRDAAGADDDAEVARVALHGWDGEYSITVQRPLIGFTYGLKWRLPTVEEYEEVRFGGGSEDRRLATAYVTKLLENASTQDAVRKLLLIARDQFCNLTNVMLESLWKKLPGTYPKKEFEIEANLVDASFQVGDQKASRLRLVAATRERLEQEWSLGYGQGIGGLALRRGMPVFHDNQKEAGPPHYLRRSDPEKLRVHNWIFSIPIGFRSLDPSPAGLRPVAWPVGVLNLGSFEMTPAVRWFFSRMQLPGMAREIGAPLQNAALDRIYADDGFAAQLRGILA